MTLPRARRPQARPLYAVRDPRLIQIVDPEKISYLREALKLLIGVALVIAAELFWLLKPGVMP